MYARANVESASPFQFHKVMLHFTLIYQNWNRICVSDWIQYWCNVRERITITWLLAGQVELINVDRYMNTKILKA